ncbi:AmiS/UreI family transporter [Melissococcus plutonius]|uniref:Urea channel UreI n=2 Tax=Melissococcus plutonius TaxID=33970 RepID=F3Y897_MELPT|nr:AmiS/UreI family transporter [Melissococcus plutonius]BAL61512.1 urea channel UreI [Melissococcus plutonius DAT561]AIM24442.1 acid-activated urea channel protein [Melissococcus plutonius S1]KMT25854.1 acid-activated urea channel protein [Melissococcus plutonius]KMT27199.1 acid-activated urea channel protein [Melissococcus plutonius]KMT28300.1 acid-activated urea channel protein [Melissococcus plutonius]
MLGVGLLFVAITLISNGVGGLLDIDQRSIALLNLLTGSLSFLINTIYLFHGDYYSAGTGYLFSFTYLLVGIIYVFDLDMKVYGIFALFVAINTLLCAYISYFSDGDWRFALIWLSWGVLWGLGFVEYVLEKPIGKPVFYLAILEGIVTCWIPGFMMLAQVW